MGISLGTGYLTSLRFVGPIGIPEILILFIIIYLFKKNHRVVYQDLNGSKSYIKSYLFCAALIILPIATFLNTLILNFSRPHPLYIISYIMSIFLCYLIVVGSSKKQINLGIVAFWFSIIFIISNLISIDTFSEQQNFRYKGGANNPNQLLFYAASLNLLLVMYQKKWAFLLLPLVVFITLKTNSDAYVLTLGIIGATYIYLKLLNVRKLSFGLKVFIHTVCLSFIAFVLLMYFGDQMKDIWLHADEGNARIGLMKNAFIASLYSPIFGLGAGSFSGLTVPFRGLEAHNNFLDFSMQFGFIFPIIIYYYILKALLTSIRRNDHLICAFIVGFIISGLFHFSGRHFVFWVELAALISYSQSKTQRLNYQGNSLQF